MKFESDVIQILLSTTINTLNAIVKFFSSVKVDIFEKSPDIACDVIFWLEIKIRYGAYTVNCFA